MVSPTHAESGKVTAAIRAARHEAGQLGKERSFIQYQNLQWAEADKRLPENFRPGLVVQFHQNSKGVRRGEIFWVTGQGEDGTVRIHNKGGVERSLPLHESAKFLVYEEREIAIAKGERIRITRNGDSADGKRLNNGNEFTVKGFTKGGQILLSNGARLDGTHGHLAYGYCQTSHSSQSKSVRDVLVAQSGDSFVASSREQFYVSCSRGKETIRIYTDDRRGLQEAVGISSTRMAGVELAELTSKDISSFMSTELGAKQWQERIQSRREGLDKSKTFVQDLVEKRRMDPLKKGESMSWRGYVEMRRANAGADGKSRSKGHPAGEKKAGVAKGRTLPKTSLHSKELVDRYKAAHEAKKAAEKDDKGEEKGKSAPAKKPEPHGRKERLGNAYRSATEHFRKIADKVRGRKAPAQSDADKQAAASKAHAKPLHQGNNTRAAAHASKEKAATAGKINAARAKVAQQTKAKQTTAPSPTRKR